MQNTPQTNIRYLSNPSPDPPNLMPNDPDTNYHCASIVFAYCVVSMNDVREVLCINRQRYPNPIMYLDFPTQVWEKRYSSARYKHRIDWQPDLHQLANPRIAQLDNVYYDSAIQVCPGQAIDRGEVPIFCPCPLENASHVIAKTSWHVIGLDDTAYHHEQIAGRLDPQYLHRTCQEFDAMLYHRTASKLFPRGADYWILPLHQYQNPQS